MARHPIKHNLNVGVLHFGLFTDKQIPPAVGLAVVAMAVLVMGGSLVLRLIIVLVLLLPVCVMILDNYSGGMLQSQVRGWIEFRRSHGVYDPGSTDDPPGYVLTDPELEARGERVNIAELHE